VRAVRGGGPIKFSAGEPVSRLLSLPGGRGAADVAVVPGLSETAATQRFTAGAQWIPSLGYMSHRAARARHSRHSEHIAASPMSWRRAALPHSSTVRCLATRKDPS
jgi:hypothetical protein